ncbi:thioesterase family protein [Litorimonas sp. RW-G-Af-16]|uniref:thioesterase family protein n=1 Tax=Litorimonas sp. RW-G-Af-16 TaxID=3241168 RepID=UPI00390C82CE
MTQTEDIGFAQIAGTMADTNHGRRPDIPENWKQGRTCYGGLSAALLLTDVRMIHVDVPPLRSAVINFVGPVTDNPTLSSEVLRQGRNVTSIAARANIGEQAVCTATFSFGAARESELSVAFPAPDAPTPNNCEDFTPDFAKAFVPAFFHRFETKLIDGHRPMSGADEGYIRAWSRHNDPASREGIESLLCIADVLPPAALPMFRKMGAVSSMTWMFNVLQDDLSTDDGWWQIETRHTAGNSGYSSQVMRIWNSRGDLVVDGMQSVTLFV